MATCPDGHTSATTDFCDVCGKQMTGGTSGSAAPVAVRESEAADELCPICGEQRTGRFCEGCSYDFVSGAQKAPAAAAAVTASAAPAPPAPEPAPVKSPLWTAVVSADRAYFEAVQAENGPDASAITFPNYCPDRTFPLSGKQIRIGRRSASRGITPEIDLVGPPEDPGVSHLHALLVTQPDGSWAVVDPGSTNGTTINDERSEIANDVPVPLSDGDRIHVGAWTTITVHAPES